MMIDEGMVVSEMWQLYHTNDPEKMDRFFNALASEVDAETLENCINQGWDECDD
ncbi:hypothetical protein [Lactobacillus sp. PSON]|uniref:hypothetical protein n=1 Tax=Lactobacillus sp. PSON TaxID=3455454 RepID=UPI00404311F3